MSADNGDKEQENLLKSEVIGNRDDIISSISRFYDNEELSDITLKLGSQRFHAHKFVLLLMSDVFQTMCSQRWDGTQVNEIELNECEQCAPVFSNFLYFLYHGQVNVTTTTALPLLMLADKYNVQSLKSCCEEYVQKQVKGGNIAGAIRWLPYLQLCGQRDLEEACVEVIVVEMESVLGSNEFLLLNLDLLKLLLARNDLVVPYEYVLYMGVVKWIEEIKKEDSSQNYTEVLIPLIRFSMMLPEHLLNIEQSTFYQSHCTVMCPFLSLAHRFRSLAMDVADEAFTESLYRPRNYTSPIWCQLVNLDADNTSFYNKTFNFRTTCDLLSTANASQESTWQVNVVRGEKHDGSSSNNRQSSQESGLWHARAPVVFPSSSGGGGCTLPLQINIRPVKPIRPNVVVDISMFLVRKDTICKALDTTTLVPLESYQDGNNCHLKNTRLPNLRFQAARDKIFQPSPMHFSFPSPQVIKEADATLKYKFPRDELDSPPEVPCVTFGPNFGHPPRPIHSIKLAIITKPRFKSSVDIATLNLPVMSDESVSSSHEEPLPILG